MKQRNGFISNSSSSSFVVRARKKETKLITQEQEQFLIGNYFKGCKYIYSYLIEISHHKPELQTENPEAYFYQVDCNEDEIITLLLQERIPFFATCHYGSYTISYQGGDIFREIQNGGIEEEQLINSYPGEVKENQYLPQNIKVADWLKENNDEDSE